VKRLTKKLPQAALLGHLSGNKCRSAVELWRSQCGSTERSELNEHDNESARAEGRQPDYLAQKYYV